MLTVVLAHALAACVAPALVRRVGRWAFLVLALVPAATFVWALTWAGTVTGGGAAVSVTPWVPALGLDLALRMGLLQWVMVLVVAGVGVLVMAYCTWYFEGTPPESLAGFGLAFTAFVGTMLGVVLADDLLLLYVFWELTTVFSYLLIGFKPTDRTGRLAAMQALLVTTLGGLAMLVGMLVLGQQTGRAHV